MQNTESASKIQELETVEEFTKAYNATVKEGCKFIVYLTGAIN